VAVPENNSGKFSQKCQWSNLEVTHMQATHKPWTRTKHISPTTMGVRNGSDHMSGGGQPKIFGEEYDYREARTHNPRKTEHIHIIAMLTRRWHVPLERHGEAAIRLKGFTFCELRGSLQQQFRTLGFERW
jgi:hypothetical protein